MTPRLPLALAWLLAAALPAAAGPNKVTLEIPSLETGAKPVAGLGTAGVQLPKIDVPTIGGLALPGSQIPLDVQAAHQLPVSQIPGAQPLVHQAAPVSQPGEGGAWTAAPQAVGQESTEQAAEAGRVQFDAAASGASELLLQGLPQAPGTVGELVAQHSARELKHVFIQQEQEGNLLVYNPLESGDVFKWYRPVEMRPELAAQVDAELSGVSKLWNGAKRAFSKKDAYAPWRSWGTYSRLSYLDKLEKAVIAEKGKDAAWKGKVSLLLEKTEAAPGFIQKHPHMEPPPPGSPKVVGVQFGFPEIVSAKESPASTVREAVGRSRLVIEQTGHAGTQYHVFMKLEPANLKAELEGLLGVVQLFNDVMFAAAANASFDNIGHRALNPWHSGRSRRAAQIVARAAAGAQASAGEDLDSEKHAFVGFRYWGQEDGRLVVSIELRGAGIPIKSGPRPAARDMGEGVPKRERDYSEVTGLLTILSAYAEKAAQGKAPRIGLPDVKMDARAVDAYLAPLAEAQGIPPEARMGIEEFSRLISGAPRAPPGFMFPFAADGGSPSAKRLGAVVTRYQARVKALQAAGRLDEQMRVLQYEFWSDYAVWAQDFGKRRQRVLEALFRAVAAD